MHVTFIFQKNRVLAAICLALLVAVVDAVYVYEHARPPVRVEILGLPLVIRDSSIGHVRTKPWATSPYVYNGKVIDRSMYTNTVDITSDTLMAASAKSQVDNATQCEDGLGSIMRLDDINRQASISGDLRIEYHGVRYIWIARNFTCSIDEHVARIAQRQEEAFKQAFSEVGRSR